MKPAPFSYHRARDVADATRLLRDLGDEAKAIAGGQSLVAMMNFRLARPAHLVDLSRISGLQRVSREVDGLHLGALVTHHQVENAELGPDFAVIRETMPWIGHLPIRTRGTVGGSLAHADSTAEWCILALVLDAVIVVQGPGGIRRIPAVKFFLGLYTTSLDPDELIIEVVFPVASPRAALTEFAERRGDFALVAAAVRLDCAGHAVTGGRVVLGGVGPVPVRVEEAERVLADGGLAGPDLFAACAEAAVAGIDPGSDSSGSAHFRNELARTLILRACEEAMTR